LNFEKLLSTNDSAEMKWQVAERVSEIETNQNWFLQTQPKSKRGGK